MDETDRIKRLRKRLYSRNTSVESPRRRGLRSRRSAVDRAWAQSSEVGAVVQKKKKRSLLWPFFITSLLFFVGSLLFGSFYFLEEKNVVSPDNVEIKIQGPTTVGGGEDLQLQLSIVNKNPVTLELVDLLIDFPEGTRSLDDEQSELLRSRESLGDIAPGERIRKSIGAILFGEKNTQKDITVTLEYRIAGSNAIFFAEKTYQVVLSSSPINVSIESFGEIVSGQEIDFSVVISSNSNADIKDLVLQVEYPFGFSFISSQPNAQFSNSVWDIGVLKPEKEKVIRIVGVMTGQANEERFFRFAVGERDEFDVNKLATTFAFSSRGVTIQRPFISTDLTLNNKREDVYAFRSGEKIRGEIAWKNNLTEIISDVQIEVRISGESVDETSVIASNGFYNSATDTLRWGRDTLTDFIELIPSQTGILQFSFKTKNITTSRIRNPEILLEVTVRGKRKNENNVPELIEFIITRKVRIISDLALTSRLLYNTGPLSNTGPLPPIVEKETFYSVVWTVTNTANHVSGAKVTGILPSYVRWVGNISPRNASVSFNANNNKVTWEVGEIPQGVGDDVSPEEVAFQIAFTPSISQVTLAPFLLNTQTIEGFDQFTEMKIRLNVPALTTKIRSESGLPNSHERVVRE